VHDIRVKWHLDGGDIAAVRELLAAASEADAHPALGEHAWLDLVQGGREGFASLVAWEPGHAHPVGYAQLSLGQRGEHPHLHEDREQAGAQLGTNDREAALGGSPAGLGPRAGGDAAGEAPLAGRNARAGENGQRGQGASWALEVVVDPHHRTPGSTIAEDLVGSAIDLIASEGGGHLHLWVNQPAPYHDRMAAAAGLVPGRVLYQMRRPLPAEEHATILTRPFRPGLDEEAWLEVNNRSFRWHPEQGGWTTETIKAREAQPWFDAEGFLLHEREGRLAGFCWTKVQPHDGDNGHEARDGHDAHHNHSAAGPPAAPTPGSPGKPGTQHRPNRRGEIYVVAVDPDFSGQGLGRQLTLAGLDYLARRQVDEAMLYVDASNVPAVKLYVGLGFAVNHIDRAYTGDVPPKGLGSSS
jgi:mycothiol synthase